MPSRPRAFQTSCLLDPMPTRPHAYQIPCPHPVPGRGFGPSDTVAAIAIDNLLCQSPRFTACIRSQERSISGCAASVSIKVSHAASAIPAIAIRGHQRPSEGIRGIRGHQGASGAIRGYQGPSGVIRGHQGPSEAIRGHQGPSEGIRGIRGHQGPSVSIKGHQRASGAIRGHQRLSGVIRGYQGASEGIRGRQRASVSSLILNSQAPILFGVVVGACAALVIFTGWRLRSRCLGLLQCQGVHKYLLQGVVAVRPKKMTEMPADREL